MPVTLTCPCGKLLDIAEPAHGKPAQCPSCGNVFIAGSPITPTTAIQDGEPEAKVPAPISLPKYYAAEVPSIEKLRSNWPMMCWAGLAAILALIAVGGVWFVFFDQAGAATQEDAARLKANLLTQACKAHFIKNNRWPESLKELTVKDQDGAQFWEDEDSLKDPWGIVYQYDVKGTKNHGNQPEIWTVSPGGVTIGNWPRER